MRLVVAGVDLPLIVSLLELVFEARLPLEGATETCRYSFSRKGPGGSQRLSNAAVAKICLAKQMIKLLHRRCICSTAILNGGSRELSSIGNTSDLQRETVVSGHLQSVVAVAVALIHQVKPINAFATNPIVNDGFILANRLVTLRVFAS